MSNPKSRLPQRRLALWAVLLVVVLGGGALALSGALSPSEREARAAYFEVRQGPLVISVTESGTIKNREQVVIKSGVEGRTTILFLAPEGIRVEPGALLVELDSSRLVEQMDSQQITVIKADAAYVQARENLEVVRSLAESNNTSAGLDLRFAKLDLEKYQKGDYPQQLQKAEGDITIAREEVQRSTDKLAWSKRLHEQRYLSRIELQADELALKKAELDLEQALRNKEVLARYSSKRDLEQYTTSIEQAQRALDRTKRKGAADIVQAEAERRARESEWKRQTAQLEKLEDQIKKCKIHAPVAGMVVYATTSRGGWRGRQEPLEEGQEVRERQELINLPTATSMMADVKVHESSLKKVRVGLPVRISVDAAPGRLFDGKVAKIGVLPDSQSVWLNPDLKLYNTDVHISGDGSDLRPGMSCRAEIFVERYEDAVQVPVQCVVRVAGKPTVYVKTADGVEARPIEIGLDNNRMLHVKSGLRKGERVLLNPPLSAGRAAPGRDAPEIPPAAEPPPPNKKPDEAPKSRDAGGSVDWKNMTREERRKRFEQLTPKERAKMMEEFRKRGGGGRGDGGERGGGGERGDREDR